MCMYTSHWVSCLSSAHGRDEVVAVQCFLVLRQLRPVIPRLWSCAAVLIICKGRNGYPSYMYLTCMEHSKVAPPQLVTTVTLADLAATNVNLRYESILAVRESRVDIGRHCFSGRIVLTAAIHILNARSSFPRSHHQRDDEA